MEEKTTFLDAVKALVGRPSASRSPARPSTVEPKVVIGEETRALLEQNARLEDMLAQTIPDYREQFLKPELDSQRIEDVCRRIERTISRK